MLITEFHCHTIHSPDCLTTPQTLVATCQRKGIDRVVVTDHNTIIGALKAKELDPERVIIGEEIMTTEGPLIAFAKVLGASQSSSRLPHSWMPSRFSTPAVCGQDLITGHKILLANTTYWELWVQMLTPRLSSAEPH